MPTVTGPVLGQLLGCAILASSTVALTMKPLEPCAIFPPQQTMKAQSLPSPGQGSPALLPKAHSGSRASKTGLWRKFCSVVIRAVAPVHVV